MRTALPLLLMLALAAPAHASLFSSSPDADAEITASQYASLLAVRDIAPKLFRQKLLPLIEKAMQDGKLSNAELAEIEKAAGSIGPQFLTAAKAPSLGESFNEALDAAGKKSEDLGDKLNQTLSEDMPKLLDDTMKFFHNQLNKPATPQSGHAGTPSQPQVTDL